MWSELDNRKTNQAVVPNDGTIMPKGSEVCAYVNNEVKPMHHIHVKAGDTVYFEVTKFSEVVGNLYLEYEGKSYAISVPEITAGVAADIQSKLLTK